MLLRLLPASAVLLALAVLADASSHNPNHNPNHLIHTHRRRGNATSAQASSLRASCRKPAGSSSAAASPAPSSPAPSSSPAAPPAAPPAVPSSSGGKSGGVAAGDFKATKPADWPTATQAAATPTSTVASAHDPYLSELSKAIDNSGNPLFTEVHTGDMTWYGQSLGACGDVYDDNSFTAAVSHLLFDTWPGADPASQNRNPVCGPFVPARTILNTAGVFAPVSAIKTSVAGYVQLGGDGLLNCVGSTSPIVQCHVPLTATVTHGGKSVQVQIVDRCTACELHDIDLTPAAYAALADVGLGRTDVQWQFDSW